MTAPTATITGPLSYPGNSTKVASRTVTFACVGPDGVVLRDSDGGVVGTTTKFTDTAGAFTQVLTLNSDIDEASGVGPPGTYWTASVGVRPKVVWAFRLDAADSGGTFVIGDKTLTVTDPTPRGWTPIAGTSGDPGAIAADVIANRPAASAVPSGAIFRATDTGELWQSDGSSYTLINRPEVKHTWAKDGVTGWTQQPISTDGAHAPNTLSVVARRARIASAPSDTPASYRECWLRDGTSWADSEIRSVWYPPSTLDPAVCAPQMGHVHRGSTTGGILVDQNIVGNAFELTYLANWGWNAAGDLGSFVIGLNSNLQGGTAQNPLVRSVARINSSGWKNVYLVDDPGNYAAGDTVTIAGCTDSTFNVNATIVSVSRDPNVSLSVYGPVIVTDAAGSTTAVTQKTEIGYFRYQAPAVNAMNPKLIYPMNVVSRLVGTVLSLKKWRVGKPEPAWGAPYVTQTLDVAGDPTVTPPTSGKCGIISNHLRGGGYAEYGDVTMTRL